MILGRRTNYKNTRTCRLLMGMQSNSSLCLPGESTQNRGKHGLLPCDEWISTQAIMSTGTVCVLNISLITDRQKKIQSLHYFLTTASRQGNKERRKTAKHCVLSYKSPTGIACRQISIYINGSLRQLIEICTETLSV